MKPTNEPFCEECDLFESKNASHDHRDDRWFALIKFGTLTCALIMVLGITGYIIKQSLYRHTDQPIVVFPSTEPLKVTPNVEIMHEEADDHMEESQKTSPVLQNVKVKSQKIKQNAIYEKVRKKQESIHHIPVAPKTASTAHAPSYYISLGIFDTHEKAYEKWEQVKGEYFEDFMHVEPIIRIVPLKNRTGYQLMAGPISKQKGLRLAEKFRTTLLSVND